MEGGAQTLATMMGVLRARFGPMTASVLIHVGIVGSVLLAPGAPVRTPVLFAELVEPDAPPPPSPPKPIVPDRRPLRLPKLIETPMPVAPVPHQEPEVPKPEAAPSVLPAPPAPVASPAPVVSPSSVVPAAPSTAAASGPPEAPAADPGAGAFAVASPSGPPSSSTPGSSVPTGPTGPAVAALPTDGITQRAIPQGGYQHRPAYPSSARRLGVQGTTLLSVLVADDGRVANVVVAQSAGHPDLDQAAAEAVRRWRFEPARRGTEKVAMWVQLPVEFRLR
jgi:periplasmic protein TonB